MNFTEIEDAVKKAKNGDMESMIELIKQFKPFIIKQSGRFNIKNMDRFDLIQTGYVALIKAVSIYNPDKNTFSAYVYSAIKNNMKYALRSSYKYNTELSLNAPIDENSNSEFINNLDSKFNLEEFFFKNEKVKELTRLLSKLKEDELELIIMCYYNGFSLKAYSEKKNISYLKVVRLKNKIFKKLKYQLADNHS